MRALPSGLASVRDCVGIRRHALEFCAVAIESVATGPASRAWHFSRRAGRPDPAARVVSLAGRARRAAKAPHRSTRLHYFEKGGLPIAWLVVVDRRLAEHGASMVDALRQLTRDCLAKHLFDSAAFYAEKLVTLGAAARRGQTADYAGPASPAWAPLPDAYLYCQSLFFAKRHRSVLLALTSRGPTGKLVDKDPRFLHLAALSAAALEQWEDVIDLLGGVAIADHAELERLLFSGSKRRGGGSAGASAAGSSLRDASAACLLRARAFSNLGSLQQAATWYAHALHADPRCAEAWEALHASRQLRSAEEAALVRSLSFEPAFEWLRSLYLSQCLEIDRAEEHLGAYGAKLGPSVRIESAEGAPLRGGLHSLVRRRRHVSRVAVLGLTDLRNGCRARPGERTTHR